MAEGPLQAVMHEGPVCWPFGAPDPEEIDKGKEAKEAEGGQEAEGTPNE